MLFPVVSVTLKATLERASMLKESGHCVRCVQNVIFDNREYNNDDKMENGIALFFYPLSFNFDYRLAGKDTLKGWLFFGIALLVRNVL